MSHINLNDFLCAKMQGEVKSLYREFLYILEELRDENKISLDEYSRKRKRVLDYGNDTIRELEKQVGELEITFRRKNESETNT